ncbi:MAG: sulfur carrier protein ThiS, partial [Gammaproteobacteria bacterium]
MQLQINGEPHQLPDGISVLDMLKHLGFGDQRVAVEVNREIVPRSTHAEHQ